MLKPDAIIAELEPVVELGCSSATWRRPRSGSPTRSSRGAGVGTSSPARPGPSDSDVPLDRRGAQRPVRQPPDRGQPAVLLPHDRGDVRARRTPGASGTGAGRPRRGGTRSPSATTSPSPGRSTRSPSSGPAWPRSSCGQVPEPESPPTASPTSPCRSWPPGSPTTTPASSSTTPPATRCMKRVASDENRHYIFYRDLVTRRPRDRPVGRGPGHRPPGAGLRDARHRHRRLRHPRPGHRQGRDLRLPASTTTRSSSRSSCATGASSGLEGLDAEAEAARQSALRYIGRVGKAAKRLARHREPALA